MVVTLAGEYLASVHNEGCGDCESRRDSIAFAGGSVPSVAVYSKRIRAAWAKISHEPNAVPCQRLLRSSLLDPLRLFGATRRWFSVVDDRPLPGRGDAD
jgi:hypothetical protein